MYYVISDLNFNSSAAAKKQNLEVKDYNQMIINKWNEIVDDDGEDYVFVFGCFATTRDSIREIICRLNGKIILTEFNENRLYSIEQWRNYGICSVWASSFKYSLLEDEKEKWIYFPNETEINYEELNPLYDYYCVSNNKKKSEEVFDGKHLNLAAEYWDFTPIFVEEIPNIILRLKDFVEEDTK